MMRFVLQACRKIVVRGGFCSSHPEVVWHSYCLEKSARQQADIKCGVCSKKVTVGGSARREDEEEEEEVSQRPRKQAGRRSQAVEEEEIEEISPRAYKSARRGSGKRSKMEVESEEEPSQAGRGRIDRRPSGESDSEDSG